MKKTTYNHPRKEHEEMTNRTVYVSEADLPVWEKGEKELGESVSSVVMNYLRRRVTEADERRQGMKRISVDVMTSSGKQVTKSFSGVWLIEPYEEFEPEEQDLSNGGSWRAGHCLAVAETARGQFAVYSFKRGRMGEDPSELEVFPTRNDLEYEHPEVERRLQEELDSEIELDI